MELLRVAALVAATLTTGLSAGMFYVFSHAIMPGLGRANDRTFVGGFQAIDKAIVNPWFLFGYLGSVVCWQRLCTSARANGQQCCPGSWSHSSCA
jgi:uncharacterized membrane protein